MRHSPYLGEHIRYNVFGAVRPKDGRLGALLFNRCDSVTFQVFLDTLAEENPPVAGRRAILVLDNASWHKTKSLNWHHFEPEYLAACSPDLNPIERFWLRMKADWFNGWIAKTPEQLQDRLIEALRSLFDQPDIPSPNAVQRPIYDILFENRSTLPAEHHKRTDAERRRHAEADEEWGFALRRRRTLQNVGGCVFESFRVLANAPNVHRHVRALAHRFLRAFGDGFFANSAFGIAGRRFVLAEPAKWHRDRGAGRWRWGSGLRGRISSP